MTQRLVIFNVISEIKWVKYIYFKLLVEIFDYNWTISKLNLSKNIDM